MKIRTKNRITALVWFVGGLLNLWLILKLSQWFLISLFTLFILVALYSLSLKCPKCGKPVLNNPIRVFGVELWLTTPWVPKKCTRCGQDLE
jgi:hypothetical protein